MIFLLRDIFLSNLDLQWTKMQSKRFVAIVSRALQVI